ncbi:MAG: ABC transporter permease [Gemmatimonadota bacterium]
MRGTVASLVAVVGIGVGTRAMMALELPGFEVLLRLPPLPRATFGILWSPRARWPDELQAAAVDRLVALGVALLLAAALVALLNALVRLAEGAFSRRPELLLRTAVGATPLGLARLLLADLRRLTAVAFTLGLLTGMALGGILRATWPGVRADLGWLEAAAELTPPLLVLTAILVVTYAGVGWRTARSPSLMGGLVTGGRASDPRGAVGIRRILGAVQMSVAGTVVLGAWSLAGTAGAPPPEVAAGHDVQVGDFRDADAEALAAARASLRAVPGLEAESLSTPGALLGLGVRAPVLAQCGQCVRGGLPVPLWGAEVDHHAVAPGYFRLAGASLLDGRVLDGRDGPDAPRVAVVNRTFARTAFEKGRPVGKMIRVGWDPEAWYTVVGVVADERHPVPGADPEPRGAVYLSALQNPTTVGSILLRGTDEAVEEAVEALGAAGLSASEPRSLAEERRAAALTLRWGLGIALLGAGLTFALALLGTASATRQITRRQRPALAVRRALGAADRAIVIHVLGGAAAGAAWGAAGSVLAGTAVVALLQTVAGDAARVGVQGYLVVVGSLLLASVLAALRSAGEALQVEPSRALD